MTKPEISDQAVEAACVAQYERERGRDTWVRYEDMPQDFTDRYRSQALLILEAAAPYMLAEAWRDGCAEGLACDWDKGAEFLPLNPYRSQP